MITKSEIIIVHIGMAMIGFMVTAAWGLWG